MNLARLFDVLAALVGVAGVMVFVTSPQTASIITATGGAFAEATRAATGKG
jgi:hypothetical protein